MKKRKKIALSILVLILIGFMIPQPLQMPVKGAGKADYNPDSFWYYPWGKSVTHKGVDIFAAKGSEVYAATPGLVLYAGELSLGGKVVFILGPKWRLHYYAHLDELKTTTLALVSSQSQIGTVGTSGNAAGKQAHLHYSIFTLFPYVWRIDNAKQGWKKMFYLDPVGYLED